MSTAPRYVGERFARADAHDGALPHVVGVSSYQVLRACREDIDSADGFGNTYNHAPMLTYWRDKFYLSYISNPVSEHTGAGMTFLAESADGRIWSKPRVCFPAMNVPTGPRRAADGTLTYVKEGTCAVMHQRMGFYESSKGRLLACGFYGWSPNPYTVPWQKHGIGRVVREVREDGSLSDIYFVRLLTYSGWSEGELAYPLYTSSDDMGLREACEELLSDRLATQQWAEEHGDADACVYIKTGDSAENKQAAFCSYHIDENTIAGLWKLGKTGISTDGGDSWSIGYEPSFVTSGAKSWGQRTEDGRFAIAYVNNVSSEHRYPLVSVTSDNGIDFSDMGAICWEVPPRRYTGTFKDFGPQYVRGICEGHADYPHGAMWLCHSMNKEDIFVTRVPLPIRTHEESDIAQDFSREACLDAWCVYSLVRAPVGTSGGALVLSDAEKCDYCRAERGFAPHASGYVEFEYECDASRPFEAELCDDTGLIAARVYLSDKEVSARHASGVLKLFETSPLRHRIRISFDRHSAMYRVTLDGVEASEGTRAMFVNITGDVCRVVFRSKARRSYPGFEDIPSDMPDMPHSDERVPMRTLRIYSINSGR